MPKRELPTPEQLNRRDENRHLADKRLTAPPIIMGGCGRSGTTLLLSIVSAHPQVLAIAPETHIFCPDGYGSLTADNGLPFPIEPNLYEHFDPLRDQDAAFDRWCEKTPRNILFFERIADHFNGHVRFLHIVRDGRDVVLSRHPVRRETYWVSIERWIVDVTAGLTLMNHPRVGPLMHTVRYEDLIRDNDAAVRGICEFLGVPVTDEMVDWHRHATVRENAAWSGEVKPLFESSIGKWRTTDDTERVAELMAQPEAVRLLEAFGYPT